LLLLQYEYIQDIWVYNPLCCFH